jgi:spore maturation protein CgeB
MTRPCPSLKILSYTATGVVVPHSMTDVQLSLARMGYSVWVQNIAALRNSHERIVAIVDGLVTVRPDILFVVDHVGLLPEVISLLAAPPRVVSWFYDNPLEILHVDFLAMNSVYYIFCWDRSYLPALKRMGFANVEYQPFATNPDVYRPGATGGFDHEVSFVGTWSPQRMDLLRALAARGIPIDVFGDELWRQADGPNLRYRGAACNRKDCPRIYACSKINLNITSRQLITSLPVRIFDVLAAGGFLLTDRREDIERLLTPGRDVIVYETADDLTRKIRFYLNHEDERERVRRAGRATVLANYTFDRILPAILDRILAESNRGLNRAPPLGRLASHLWLTGLGYLKAGRIDLAGERLMDALRLRPRDEQALLATALLGNHIGHAGTVATCAEALADGGCASAVVARHWTQATARGERIQAWDLLYRGVYSDVSVDAEGRVAGWNPQPVFGERPEPAEAQL